MIIALDFAHFSSELLLKEQMIIPVKKNVKQRWSYRPKIDRFWRNLPKKNPAKQAVFFTDCFLAKFPSKFPVKLADFSANFDFFPAKISRNWPIFPQNMRSPVYIVHIMLIEIIKESIYTLTFCQRFHMHIKLISRILITKIGGIFCIGTSYTHQVEQVLLNLSIKKPNFSLQALNL